LKGKRKFFWCAFALAVLGSTASCGTDTQDVLLLLSRQSPAKGLFIRVCESGTPLDCSDETVVFEAGADNLERSIGIAISDTFESDELQLLFEIAGRGVSRCDSTLVDLMRNPLVVKGDISDLEGGPTLDCVATGTCAPLTDCGAEL